MKKLFFLLLFSILFSSCIINQLPQFDHYKSQNPWVSAFKDRVFIKCLEHSYSNSDTILKLIGKTDAFNPYDGIYSYLEKNWKYIDSIGKSIPKNAPTLWLDDYKDHNTYLCNCLHYYESRELDSIAKKEYKKNSKRIKKRLLN